MSNEQIPKQAHSLEGEAPDASEREARQRATEEGKRGPNEKGQTVAPTPEQAQQKRQR